MTRPTGEDEMSSEHVAHLQRMANESWIGSPERAALDAAIASLSAQQHPAEAQAADGKLLSEGGAGCHDCDGYQAEGVFCPTCGTDHSEPPPSAPVGVEAKDAEIEALRAEVAAWQELSGHVRAGACNAIWPDRYTDARTRDVAAALKRAERLAEALRDARDYVKEALQDEREKFAGHEHCSDIDSIMADISAIDFALECAALRDHDQEVGNG